MALEEHAAHRSNRNTRNGTQLARGLGWFSVGLGLTQLAAPGWLGRTIGLRDGTRQRWIMRAMGARELVAGAAIITRARPALPVWARVGGDVVDLAFLTVPIATGRANPLRAGAATAAVLGVTALDVLSASRMQRHTAAPAESGRLARMTPTKKITINRPVEDVRRIWQDARGRSGLFPHLAEHANAISFATALNGRGTEVTLTLSAIESRKAGSLISRTLGRVTGTSAVQDADRELRVLKQLVETGEVSRSEATAHGHPHPAIPLSQQDADRAREKVAA